MAGTALWWLPRLRGCQQLHCHGLSFQQVDPPRSLLQFHVVADCSIYFWNAKHCQVPHEKPARPSFASGEWSSTSQHITTTYSFQYVRSMINHKSSQYPHQNICYVDSMAPAWWMFNLWHQPLSPRGPKKTSHRLGAQMLLELGGGLAELGPWAMGTMGTDWECLGQWARWFFGKKKTVVEG